PGRVILTLGEVGQRKDGSWPDSFRGQVEQAVANISTALIAGGGYPRDIVQLRFYVVGWTESLAMDIIGPVTDFLRNDHGMPHKPLTTLLPVSKLAFPEAKHRIGGRSLTQSLRSTPDAFIDMGAAWINKTTQPTVYALCEKFGLETVEQYTKGDTIEQDHDGRTHRTPEKPSENTSISGPIERFRQIVTIAASERTTHRFDDFPENQDVSLSKWVESKGLWQYPEVRGACEWLCLDVVGRGSNEVGMYYFLDHLQSGPGLEMIATKGDVGPQSLRVKKGVESPTAQYGTKAMSTLARTHCKQMDWLTASGTSAISDAIANDMPAGSILLSSPVGEIVQRNTCEAYVTTESGLRCKAKKVILAIPTNAYSKVHFTPPLSQIKRSLVSKVKPSIYSKVVLSYTAPWWRDAGLSGKFQSRSGPICFSWDVCDLEAKQYGLALFVLGKIATSWHDLSKLEREEAIVEHLAMLVGSELAPKAWDVKEINMAEWSEEEYVWGIPTSSIESGLLMKYDAASRESFGDLHFGGSETAYEWKGYLEGAIAAGKRVAAEVIESLNINK
ncbi:amine oxidase, partial [Colletotrichum incanum]